jgi:hypothetical protein
MMYLTLTFSLQVEEDIARGTKRSRNQRYGVSSYKVLSHFRITVVHKRFYFKILHGNKLVEFRSANSSFRFVPGLCLLFSLNGIWRKRGMNSLVFARVSDMLMLTYHEAVSQFPREAADCDLEALMAGWGNQLVRCFVLDPSSIRIALEIVHLEKGCLGLVNQFAIYTGKPHFCHSEDVGKLVSLVLPCGTRIDRRLVVTWPKHSVLGSSSGGGMEIEEDKDVERSEVTEAAVEDEEEDEAMELGGGRRVRGRKPEDDDDDEASEAEGCRRVGGRKVDDRAEDEDEDGDGVGDDEDNEELGR